MRGLRPPRFPTVFEALVNGVACQQLSLAVGIHLLNRLTADRGRPLCDDLHGPRAFPGPEELAPLEPDELKRHGFSTTKARTIVETARAIVAGCTTPPDATKSATMFESQLQTSSLRKRWRTGGAAGWRSAGSMRREYQHEVRVPACQW